MAFTNFCCRSGGSNLNAGTRTGDTTEPGTTAFKTYVSGTWVQSTRTFTPAGGANPTTDGIAVGDFVSVYPDAATVSPYVARITTVGATTFVTSASAFAGTAPVDGALVTSASIGGAWKGPNAAEQFPFNFVTSVLTNASANIPRVNLKNDAQYNVTAAINHTLLGPVFWEGYTTAYGDLGRATIDGGTSGASYVLCTLSGNRGEILDIIFANNGATGSAGGVVISGTYVASRRCVAHDVLGNGIAVSGAACLLDEPEVYLSNKSNTASLGAINSTVFCQIIRPTLHDNSTGANCHGIINASTNGISVLSGIIESNAGSGILVTANSDISVFQTDFYNNTGTHILVNTGLIVELSLENCNFLKGGAYAISLVSPASQYGSLRNCGFGVGTQANSSGNLNGNTHLVEVGSINYATGVTPWVDPDNGDFRINLAAAINAGRGTFTETAASYAGTIGYPDIGAGQHLEAAAAAGLQYRNQMRGNLG